MPARVYTPPMQRREEIPNVAKALTILVAFVAVLVYLRQPVARLIPDLFETGTVVQDLVDPSISSEAVQPPKPVWLKFDPPFALSDSQWDYADMSKDVINNPSAWGVNKPPLNFDRNLLELYMSVLRTENNLSHYDSDGNIAWSYSGCCLGGAQVYAQTSICTREELEDPRYNVWCGAAIFKGYYDEWAPKAGDRANEITVAVYKNAVVMTPDLTAMVLDQQGLPIIPEDDPDDPKDMFSQVQSVFLYDGQPMFKFVSE